MPKPTFKFAGSYAGGKNLVYDIYMPDGNSFRYCWGRMIPYHHNKVIQKEDYCESTNEGNKEQEVQNSTGKG